MKNMHYENAKRGIIHFAINMFTHECVYETGFPIIKKDIAKFELVWHLGIMEGSSFHYYKRQACSHVISYHTTMYC